MGMWGGVTTPTSRRCSGRFRNSGKERCTKTDLPSSEGGPGSYRRTGVCVMFWDPERIHQERWGCQENRLADMLCYLHDDLESISSESKFTYAWLGPCSQIQAKCLKQPSAHTYLVLTSLWMGKMDSVDLKVLSNSLNRTICTQI